MNADHACRLASIAAMLRTTTMSVDRQCLILDALRYRLEQFEVLDNYQRFGGGDP